MKNEIEDMKEFLHKSLNVENYIGSIIANQFIVDVDIDNKKFTVYSEKNPENWREFKLSFDYLDNIAENEKSDYKLKIRKHSEKVIERKLENYESWKRTINNELKIEKGKVNDEEIMLKAINKNPYFLIGEVMN
ncbi:hypothetical protein KX935_03565 [Streptobacillus moniliformis]|nr:hypothetical protein KX935_03565 [Streptobacillus moniliformis]